MGGSWTNYAQAVCPAYTGSTTQNSVLEMICGESIPTRGGQNEEFVWPLIGYRKCGKSFTEGENEREIKSQISVVLRPVSLRFVAVKKKNLWSDREEKRNEKEERAKWQASPASND